MDSFQTPEEWWADVNSKANTGLSKADMRAFARERLELLGVKPMEFVEKIMVMCNQIARADSGRRAGAEALDQCATSYLRSPMITHPSIRAQAMHVVALEFKDEDADSGSITDDGGGA